MGRNFSQIEGWRMNGAMRAWEAALAMPPGSHISDLLDAFGETSGDIDWRVVAVGGRLPPGWVWVDQEPTPPEAGSLPPGWSVGSDGKPVCPKGWMPE